MRRVVLILPMLAACSSLDEPPLDLDTSTSGDQGEPKDPVVYDGKGRGTLWPYKILDCAEGDSECTTRYALVIGAPRENWMGVVDSGQVSIVVDQKTGTAPAESLMLPLVSPATIVEDLHAPACPQDQRFAWDLLPDRKFGGSFSFWTTVGRFNTQGGLLASAPTAGAASGRVMMFDRCRSCALFPKQDGEENLRGGNFGAAVTVGIMAEGPAGEAEERIAIGAPLLESGQVAVLDVDSYLQWIYGDSSYLGTLEGIRECQCANQNSACHPWDEVLEGSFASEEFGAALTAADVDCDGFDDLIVGAPGADLPSMRGTIEDAGAVYVYLNSPDPLGDELPTVLRQSTPEVGGEASPGDRFGTTLAAGNFNGAHRLSTGQGCFDFAVGTPDEGGHGQVQIFEGGPGGVVFGGPIIDLDDIAGGSADDGDQFGWALVAVDLDGNGYDDLVIGAPGDDGGGSVTIIPGSNTGLNLAASTRTRQDDLGDDNAVGDQFGYSLSWTKLAGGTTKAYVVLVVGVPGEDQDVGRVGVYRVSGLFHLYSGASIWQGAIEGDQQTGDRFGHSMLQPRPMPDYPGSYP